MSKVLKMKRDELKAETTKVEPIVIKPPKFQHAKVKIIGTSPLMMNKMSAREKRKMMEGMLEGSRGKKGKNREPKNFEAEFRDAIHYSDDGWYGFPASAFRAAMISACKTVGFAMTRAKLSLFVLGEGFDRETGEPLVRVHGEPERVDMVVRIQNTTNLIARPVWKKWHITLHLRWDADQFSSSDVANLINRVGQQVGIGAGRHDSRQSTGLGYGCFEVEN